MACAIPLPCLRDLSLKQEAGASPARSRHCDRLIAVSQALLRVQLRAGRVIPEVFMTYSATQNVAIPTIPVGEILPWAVFGGLLMLLAIYFVGSEQGATSLISGAAVHEFVHDARHLLGFPCH
jgi:hypothetical protein